jgi:hypothetical protein
MTNDEPLNVELHLVHSHAIIIDVKGAIREMSVAESTDDLPGCDMVWG